MGPARRRLPLGRARVHAADDRGRRGGGRTDPVLGGERAEVPPRGRGPVPRARSARARLGTEAVRRVVARLSSERGHHRLTIDPAADNVAAIRAYEKVGFRPVGVMRAYERDAGGDGWHDGLLMELVVDDRKPAADAAQSRPMLRRLLHALTPDLSPLRGSRDYRLIVTGTLVTGLGTQTALVALPYQRLRHHAPAGAGRPDRARCRAGAAVQRHSLWGARGPTASTGASCCCSCRWL